MSSIDAEELTENSAVCEGGSAAASSRQLGAARADRRQRGTRAADA